MKITATQLRSIIKEEIRKVLSEDLKPGDKVDSNDKFDLLKPGDSIKINGKLCTVVSLDHFDAHLNYVIAGKSVRKSMDYRYAIAWEEGETPETDVEWVGKGAPPAKTRRPARKKSPFDYPVYD